MSLAAPLAGRARAELDIDERLVGRLLESQHPDLAGLPLAFAAEGWDNVIFRLGDDLALRLPRRQAGADLIVHELAWLPTLAPRLPLPIPTPVRQGRPGEGYPWPWSLTPWFAGETADLSPPDEDQGEVLGAFFAALHREAPEGAPVNPWRGTPLAQRKRAFEVRRLSLAASGVTLSPDLKAIWVAAVSAPDDAAPTWIHGDPHPRNILVRQGRIVAVIDWGDVARGDRASDLAGVWMVLPQRAARAAAMAVLTGVSPATWARARGWALHFALLFIEAGLAGDAPMAPIGRRILENLSDGP